MNISDLQALLAEQLTDTEVMISIGGGTPVPIESVAVVTKKPREPSVVVLSGQRPKVTRSGCASEKLAGQIFDAVQHAHDAGGTP